MQVLLILAFFLTNVCSKKADYITKYICEGSELDIRCEEGYRINLIRANYGRFSIGICNENGTLNWRVNCLSMNSFHIIRERCHQMSNCKVSATSDVLEDTCPGTYKYLEVHYVCYLEALNTTSTTMPTSTATTRSLFYTTSSVRPTVIIPITRSNRPPVITTTSRAFTTSTTKPSTTASTTVVNSYFIPTTVNSFPSNVVTPTKGKKTTTSPIFNEAEYCPPVYSRDLFWSWTKTGTVMIQKCPGGTTGDAHWYCGTDPVVWVDKPDLSRCCSLWVENLKNRIDSGDSVVNIAAELAVMTQRKPIYGEDIKQASEILHSLIFRMRDKMKDIADDKQQHQLLQELLEKTSDVINNLFEIPLLWDELTPHEKQSVVSTVLETLEHSGWMLASSHKSPFSFERNLHNLFLSVQVVDSWSTSHIMFPSTNKTNEFDEMDLLSIPMESLLGTSRNGLVKVVFITYDHIENFFGSSVTDYTRVSDNASIINSKIISAYTGSYSGIRFPVPVTISFNLIKQENVSNPQCVHWDLNLKLWSQDGCWLKNSNKTHAVCACNHLTNFALFMDNKAAVGVNENYIAETLMFVSGGVTIVFLLITVIILHVLRGVATDHSLIHKHMCVCLICAEIIYMLSINQVHAACAILAGCLHFFLQAVFVWLLLSALQLYLLSVEAVYHKRSFYYTIIGYSVPLLIILISAAVDSSNYGTTEYCFLRLNNSYVFSFFGPASICITGTCIFLVLTSCKVICFSEKDQGTHKLNVIKKRNGASWLVLLSVCCSWIVLLLHMEKVHPSLAYTFQVMNGLQGLIIFIFFGLNDNQVYEAYHKWKRQCPQRKTSRHEYPLNLGSSSNVEERVSYLPPSTTVSSLSTVTTPELEYPVRGFHHVDYYQATRSPIYDNRERLVL